MRPISGGLIWGWIERAGNWACPLALMMLTGDGDRKGKAWRMPALAGLDKYLSPETVPADDLWQLTAGFLVFTWSLVFVLRQRPRSSLGQVGVNPISIKGKEADGTCAKIALEKRAANVAIHDEPNEAGSKEDFDEEKAAKLEDTLVPKGLRYNSPGRKAASSIFVDGKRRRKSPARFVAKN